VYQRSHWRPLEIIEQPLAGYARTQEGAGQVAVRQRLAIVLAVPLIRRVAYHARRMTGNLNRRVFARLLLGLAAFVFAAALLVTLIEKPKGSVEEFFKGFGQSVNWAVSSVMGSGESSQVKTLPGYVVGWLLVLFGVAIVGSVTGLLVGFVIDFLIKEGQGMGASGYRDHIVVLGWNPTARELIEELSTDDYQRRIVLLDNVPKNPAGHEVYFVQGEITKTEDLTRAGIMDAAAAIVFPKDGSDEADMRSLVAVLAIESLAPQVRTVVEVNNPTHVEHFRRAKADEILVTSRLTSRLLARSALYPGLTEIVTDIVSGGEGSELYRIQIPSNYVGLAANDLSSRLRSDHRATLLAVARNGQTFVNPPEGFVVQAGDDAVVVAESLGGLSPLEMDNALD
jgi:voltage-gated potassium channel